ncbi:hypothetical protein AMATHDRAFT_148084 [Amanita thiersii Skay4041]|uniref:RRM domain-containing protein n=1 Tax=Amanita thiersii Skay4041 TaxID=703135 RepID=A0A2A9NE19_9AGAR|nr:hypothetical protein AMATHDRAFT_148084 [Amanita thiersii Skay4041]
MASELGDGNSESSDGSDNSDNEAPDVTQKQKTPVKGRSKRAPADKDDTDSEEEDEAQDQNINVEEDVQPLSHAEKRRQKKKEKKIHAAADSSTKKRKKDDKVSSKHSTSTTASGVATKRQNSVWVGNLSYKTTQDDLKTFFAAAGGEITRIHLPLKATPGPGRKPENRGFAYVDFATPGAKAAAIALSEQPLIGRRLLIKDGDDFNGRPDAAGADGGASLGSHGGEGTSTTASTKTHSKTAQKILRAQKQPPGPTLFLGNLGYETTEANILEMLNAHHHHTTKKVPVSESPEVEGGKSPTEQKNTWIRKVRMGTFEDSGLCKGFAFVDFVTTEDATTALVNPKNFLLNGRKLVVEYASPDAVRRGASKETDAHVHGPKSNKKRKPTSQATTQGQGEDGVEEGEREDAEAEAEPALKRQRFDKSERGSRQFDKPHGKQQGGRGFKSRTRPGAALASAKRESAAIIPSQGAKIVF